MYPDSLLWSQSRFHINALTMQILGWQSWFFSGLSNPSYKTGSITGDCLQSRLTERIAPLSLNVVSWSFFTNIGSLSKKSGEAASPLRMALSVPDERV